MPATKRGLKPYEMLLVGRLRICGVGTARPSLVLAVWCPCCKTCHEHGWAATNRMDAVEHQAPHCLHDCSPFKRHGYHVGLDALAQPENEQVLAEFRALVARKPLS